MDGNKLPRSRDNSVQLGIHTQWSDYWVLSVFLQVAFFQKIVIIFNILISGKEFWNQNYSSMYVTLVCYFQKMLHTLVSNTSVVVIFLLSFSKKTYILVLPAAFFGYFKQSYQTPLPLTDCYLHLEIISEWIKLITLQEEIEIFWNMVRINH